jgi:phosphopantetheine--protein transferase-like protein
MPITKPLLNKELAEAAEIYIWQTTETENQLLEILAWDAAFVAARRAEYRHPRSWQQHLASRALIKNLNLEADFKADFRARKLADGRYFSLSHSGEVVALAISSRRIGIDIQELQPKISTLARRFMAENEYIFWRNLGEEEKIIFASLIWAAKEAMFKAWGQKGVEFSRDLLILQPVQPINTPQKLAAKAENAHAETDFTLHLTIPFCNHCLALALEEA